MIAKIPILVTFFAIAQAGYEAPPPKSQSFSVPSIAKVSYPAPTITKSVETYSAPSIEKTTTITRTITAPINAPAVRSIQYSAPAVPIHQQQAPILYAAPGFAPHAPVSGYGAPQQLVASPGQAHGAQELAPAPVYGGAEVLQETPVYGGAQVLQETPVYGGAQVLQAAPVLQAYKPVADYDVAPAYEIVQQAPAYQKVAVAPVHEQVVALPTHHKAVAASSHGAYIQQAQGYLAPDLSLGNPSLAYASQPALNVHGANQGAYAAPSLGYNVGGSRGHASAQVIRGGAYGY